MINNNLKKFSLYIDIQGDIDYSVEPKIVSSHCERNTARHDLLVNVDQSATVAVRVKHWSQGASMLIRNLEFNGVAVTDINACAVWVPVQGQAQRTHGQIDGPGVFFIRLHGNAVSHNYLNYVFSLTTT